MAEHATMDVFATMDEETAALIIQLQIEDSQELSAISEGKGKGKEGDVSDAELALGLYNEDLRQRASIIQDRQMTKSIARACQTDGNALAASLAEEQTAATDRGAAGRLGGVTAPAPVEPWTITSEELDEELLAKLSALYVEPATEDSGLEIAEAESLSDGEHDNPESSEWAATRTPSKTLHRRCVACREHVKYYDIARVPCGHEYCRDCLRDLFQASMTDDSLFPPKCCRQPLVSGGVRIFLTPELVKEYERKKIEYDTPNRTYCSNPVCSSFIKLGDIANELATCTECGTITCTMCKAVQHTGDCPADTALQQVLEAAEENGWQRCYSCRRLVELDVGCHHMTCPCGAQFCYACGLSWKTCPCPQWSEERLFARATQVVARRPAHANPQAQFATAVQNLRDRHDCNHLLWLYVRGRHQCEECRQTLPTYIFECRQCNIQACNRCRRNRL